MGNRGVQIALVVVALLFGVVAAYALNSSRHAGGPTATGSPSPTASPSELPSPSPSESAASSPSPTAQPSPEPTPAPVETTAPPGGTGAGGGGGGSTGSGTTGCSTAGTDGSGPAGYPQEVSAGAGYQYCGPRSLVVHATDSAESGGSACAGINDTTQTFPDGYRGVFFVGVQFPDRQIVSAGYVRDAAGRRTFGSIQDAAGNNRQGGFGGDPGGGSHTYCVKFDGAKWHMQVDGSDIVPPTNGEAATSVSGATLKFDSDVQTFGSPAAQDFTFTIPGFHDIAVDGGAVPGSRLRGAVFYS